MNEYATVTYHMYIQPKAGATLEQAAASGVSRIWCDGEGGTKLRLNEDDCRSKMTRNILL